MPIPTKMSDLSVTAASNSPAGSDPLSSVDDHIRALAAIVRAEQAQAASAASAATVDLGAISNGAYLHITGTTGPPPCTRGSTCRRLHGIALAVASPAYAGIDLACLPPGFGRPARP